MKKCAVCQGELESAEVAQEVTVGPTTFQGSVPGRRCAACGETFTSAAQASRFDVLVARELVQSGASSGEALRFMRRARELRAADLADVLGVTPETVSRWENGKHPIDRASWAVLAALVTEGIEGATATRLRAAASPRALEDVVRLGSAA